MEKLKTYFNWSSGKDSALALYYLLQDEKYAVDELITTINNHYNRVSMHGLRKELLIAQTKAINIPASLIELPEMPSKGMKAVFPIWKRDTKELLNEFLDLGFKTIIVCANFKYFGEEFVGTVIDKHFIDNLPEGVDPCGENGEFHTFCFDGPIFKNSIPVTIGEKVYREYDAPKTDDSVCKNDDEKYGVWYCDLIPK